MRDENVPGWVVVAALVGLAVVVAVVGGEQRPGRARTGRTLTVTTRVRTGVRSEARRVSIWGTPQ